MLRTLSTRKLILAGGGLIVFGLLAYDLATYFHLAPVFVTIPFLLLMGGLVVLAAGAAAWVWRASAGTLAVVGLAMALGFAMAAISPVAFAPPGMQGGETEVFRGVPIVLAVAGGFLLCLAGWRYMGARPHSREVTVKPAVETRSRFFRPK